LQSRLGLFPARDDFFPCPLRNGLVCFSFLRDGLSLFDRAFCSGTVLCSCLPPEAAFLPKDLPPFTCQPPALFLREDAFLSALTLLEG